MSEPYEWNVAGAVAQPLGPSIPPEFTDDFTNWPYEGGSLSATRNAMGSNITSSSVSQLQVAWRNSADAFGSSGGLVANPIVAGQLVVIQDTNSNVFAFDKISGALVWSRTHDRAVPAGGPNGVAIAYGRVFYTVGADGMVIAVDARTGDEIWAVSILGPLGEGITMAPLVYDSTVYVSTIPGSESSFYRGGQRGFIYAIAASTGDVLWYFDTTTDNLWGNARVNSGGGLWHPPSVDEAGNIYVGVGNPGPFPGTEEFPSGTSRPGPNDYTNCVMKIDAETASVDWYINVKPFDLFDLDNQLTPLLAQISIDGVERKVVFSAGKHGYVLAVDATNGTELWRTAVGKHMNDDLTELPVDEHVEVWPGTWGGVETPIAFSEGTVFVPVIQMASFYNGAAQDFNKLNGAEATGLLVAIDGMNGQILWQAEQPAGTLGSATVVNDVVLTGGLDGLVRAYKVDDGSLLWTAQVTSGLTAGVAVSGDTLFVAAGGPLFPSSDTAGTALTPKAELVAYSLDTVANATPHGETIDVPAEAAMMEGVTITSFELGFSPEEVAISAHTPNVITITNAGAFEHDFVVDALGIRTELIASGQSVQITIDTVPGTYQFYCSVPGHLQGGMVGTLKVQ